jgi:hypothetical protein
MPVPKAAGTHGSNRPGPASARIHFCNISMNGGQATMRDGTKGPIGVAARGGQVPA